MFGRLTSGVSDSFRKLFVEPSAVHPYAGDNDATAVPGLASGSRMINSMDDGGARRPQRRREILDQVIEGFLDPPSPHENLAKSFRQLRKVLWRSALEWGHDAPPINPQQTRLLYRYDRLFSPWLSLKHARTHTRP